METRGRSKSSFFAIAFVVVGPLASSLSGGGFSCGRQENAAPTLCRPGESEAGGCLRDLDADGVADAEDNCPDRGNPKQLNFDEDSWGNACDNCPELANQDQLDSNRDGVGDACAATQVPNVCGDDICNLKTEEDKTCREDCLQGLGCRPGSGFFCPDNLACVVPCNQVPECPNGEDESDLYCNRGNAVCRFGGFFFCPSEETPQGCRLACDGVVECPDGFDESLELCGGGDFDPCVEDGHCETYLGETEENCPVDCVPVCGDGVCSEGEDCVEDCQLPPPPMPSQEICNNTLDDDFDYLIDCEDPHCFADPACACTAAPGTEQGCTFTADCQQSCADAVAGCTCGEDGTGGCGCQCPKISTGCGDGTVDVGAGEQCDPPQESFPPKACAPNCPEGSFCAFDCICQPSGGDAPPTPK